MAERDSILILGATLVNEGEKSIADVYISKGRIEEIGRDLQSHSASKIIEAHGQFLFPGVIDDQVHFRDPGFPEKGTIASESRAAIAGGTTSFMDMPNTKPQAITRDELEKKYSRAATDSWANYSFYMGTTNQNLEEVKRLDPKKVCGTKIFMGASTGNMLVDDPVVLKEFFQSTPTLIATHCEDTPMILEKEKKFRKRYGDNLPMSLHPEVRSRESCLKSSIKAVELAKQTGARLHILHLSTKEELKLFEAGPLEKKRITCEVCVHHLYFSQEDYEKLGSRIKWNPSIKTSADREALRKAMVESRVDVVATDHAPHTWEEKLNPYWSCPSGGPLVQHSLIAMLELVKQGVFSLEEVIQKMCHAPALLFGIRERGFIREGYHADLALVDLNAPWTVARDNLFYRCGWSPFEGFSFSSQVSATLVNGRLLYDGKEFKNFSPGSRLEFSPR